MLECPLAQGHYFMPGGRSKISPDFKPPAIVYTQWEPQALNQKVFIRVVRNMTGEALIPGTRRCGGYAVAGVRERKTYEVYVRIDSKIDPSDCGPGTNAVVKSIKQKMERRGLKNVVVREVW